MYLISVICLIASFITPEWHACNVYDSKADWQSHSSNVSTNDVVGRASGWATPEGWLAGLGASLWFIHRTLLASQRQEDGESTLYIAYTIAFSGLSDRAMTNVDCHWCGCGVSGRVDARMTWSGEEILKTNLTGLRKRQANIYIYLPLLNQRVSRRFHQVHTVTKPKTSITKKTESGPLTSHLTTISTTWESQHYNNLRERTIHKQEEY